MQNTNVSELIQKVVESPEMGTKMFTQEQVVQILNMVQCTASATPSEEFFESLNQLLDELESDVENLEVDFDEIEFSVGYDKKIEVESAEIDKQEVNDSLDKVRQFINDHAQMNVG